MPSRPAVQRPAAPQRQVRLGPRPCASYGAADAVRVQELPRAGRRGGGTILPRCRHPGAHGRSPDGTPGRFPGSGTEVGAPTRLVHVRAQPEQKQERLPQGELRDDPLAAPRAVLPSAVLGLLVAPGSSDRILAGPPEPQPRSEPCPQPLLRPRPPRLEPGRQLGRQPGRRSGPAPAPL